jgi:hypothetical protein
MNLTNKRIFMKICPLNLIALKSIKPFASGHNECSKLSFLRIFMKNNIGL